MSDKRIVGKCGSCGGRVALPTYWHSVNPPVATCESCGAQVDDTANLPVMPMRPKPQVTLEPYREPTTGGAPGWRTLFS